MVTLGNLFSSLTVVFLYSATFAAATAVPKEDHGGLSHHGKHAGIEKPHKHSILEAEKPEISNLEDAVKLPKISAIHSSHKLYLGHHDQKHNTSASKCFTVNKSCLVPAYDGVLASKNSYFNNTATLDSFLKMFVFSDPTNQARFKKYNGCPNFAGEHLRYIIALKSAYFLSEASAACAKDVKAAKSVSFIPLCRDTCHLAVNSLLHAFKDEKICLKKPSASAKKSRKIILKKFSKFCKSLPYANNNEGQCHTGSIDVIGENKCGFVSEKFAQEYCDRNPSMKCCQSVKRAKYDQHGKISSKKSKKANKGIMSTVYTFFASLPLWSILYYSLIILLIILFLIAVTTCLPKNRESKQVKFAETHLHNVAHGSPVLQSDAAAEQQMNENGVPPRTRSAQMSPMDGNGMASQVPPRNMGPQMSPNMRHPVVGLNPGIRRATFSTYNADQTRRMAPFNQSGMIYAAPGDYGQVVHGFGPVTQDGVRIVPGYTVIVSRQYAPNYDDELALNPGQMIIAHAVYEDGWAMGRCLETGVVGAFPVNLTVFDVKKANF